MPATLLEQARLLMKSSAPAIVALALAPLADSAEAAVIASSDLQVTYSQGYFYNNSGYYSNYRTAPTSDLHATVNADGSPKLFGAISATTQDFYDHHLRVDDNGDAYDFAYYLETGLVMVWGGTFRAGVTPAAGDTLGIHYDFNFSSPNLGENGASYKVWSYFGTRQAEYTLGNYVADGHISNSEARVTGDTSGRQIEAWQLESDTDSYYWQVALSVDGGMIEFGRSEAGFNYALSPTMFLTVPSNSIDVSYNNAGNGQQGPGPGQDLPEPGSLALLLGGLATLTWRRRRR